MVQIPNAKPVGDMPKGEPVPEGVYHLRSDKVGYKESKAKKTPMAEVQWTIFGPTEAEEFHGRKIFENLMLAGEGMFKTRQVLVAAGKDEEYVLQDTDDLLNIEVAGVVSVEKERSNPET